MYNRYIPQSDGSFRRNRLEESIPTPPTKPRPIPEPAPEPKPAPPPEAPSSRPVPPKPKKQPQPVGNFLKQLLPKEFDTEDLLIVLLLLLLSGDCREDQNTAILTLVLYLFL